MSAVPVDFKLLRDRVQLVTSAEVGPGNAHSHTQPDRQQASSWWGHHWAMWLGPHSEPPAPSGSRRAEGL